MKRYCAVIINDPFCSVTHVHLGYFNESPKSKSWKVLETVLSHRKTYCSPLSSPWLIRYFFGITHRIAADKINRMKNTCSLETFGHSVIKRRGSKNWLLKNEQRLITCSFEPLAVPLYIIEMRAQKMQTAKLFVFTL